MTYEKAVEELVVAESEAADPQIAEVVDELEVGEDVTQRLGEHAAVTHQTDHQH